MRPVVQHSHCRKTHAYAAAIHLTTIENRASVLRVRPTLQDARTYVRAVISIALCRVWIVCMSTILKRLDATSKTHTTSCSVCDSSCEAGKIPIAKCCKVVVRQLWKGCYEVGVSLHSGVTAMVAILKTYAAMDVTSDVAYTCFVREAPAVKVACQLHVLIGGHDG